MTQRVAAEVLAGLHEIREHRLGHRTLQTAPVESRPLPDLSPSAIRETPDRLDDSRAVFAHMIRVPVRTIEGCEQEEVPSTGHSCRIDADGREVPRHS